MSPEQEPLLTTVNGQVADIASRFENACARGERPRIADHLPPDGPSRRTVLAALVHIEMEHRLKRGELVRVEHYLKRYPDLASDTGVVADLIVTEYALRRRRDPELHWGEYLERFPRYAALIRTLSGDSTPAENTAAPTPRLPVGEANRPAVPRHEVLGELGRGGMGVVYKARHVALDRIVALKMILAGAHAGTQALARFRAEAKAAARLQHANIVQVFEVGEQDGLPYFSMEYVEGGSLAERLAGTPQPPAAAAALVEVLARAVQYAHRQGVVHRDLKPANVLLQKSEVRSQKSKSASTSPSDFLPKITDFGLAKCLDAEAALTQPGAVLGTPSYMAPEQAGGHVEDVGPAADVYALGAILYECLTGRPPFRGTTHLETLDQVRRDEPVPPSRLRPKVPRDLETICLKCLQKEPRRRYASAGDLADDLRRFLDGRPITARPIGRLERGWKWARRRPAAAGLVALLLLVVVGLAVGGPAYAVRESVLRARTERAWHQLDKLTNDMARVAHDQLAPVPYMEHIRRDLLANALAYLEFLRRERGDDPALRWSMGRAYHRAGDLHFLLGEHDRAESAYADAKALFAALAGERPEDTELARDLGDSCNSLGNLHLKTGRHREAEEQYAEALVLRRRLAERFPNRSAFRHDLATSRRNFALLLAATGRLPPAEQEVAEAIPLLEALRAEGAAAAEVRQDLAAALDDRGNLLRDTALGDAEEAYRRALKLRQDLAAEFPELPTYRQELGATWNNLAILLESLGRTADADEAFDQALQIKKDLAEKFPATAVFRRDLVAAYNNRCSRLLRNNRLSQAEASAALAQESADRLVADFPRIPDHEYEQARAACNRAMLQQAAGRLKEADATYARAIELGSSLVDRFPAVPEYRHELGRAQCNRGTLLQLSGRPKEAEQMYGAARAAFAALRARHPWVPDYRHELANCLNNLGALHVSTSRPAEAEQLLRQALELLEELVRDFPAVPVYQQRKAVTLSNLGHLLGSLSGQESEAENVLQQAIAIQRKLIENLGNEPGYRRELARSWNLLGFVLSRRLPPAADDAFRDAIVLQEKLVEQFSGDPELRSELADYHANRAELQQRTMRWEEAKASRRRVVALRRQQAEQFPEVPAHRKNLARAVWELGRLLRERHETAEVRRLVENDLSRHRAAGVELLSDAEYRFCLRMMHSLLAEALLEAADYRGVARVVEELADVRPAMPEDSYVAARYLALCVPLPVVSQELARTYADRAMIHLQRAKDMLDAARLREEFRPLQQRDDFRRLLQELTSKN